MFGRQLSALLPGPKTAILQQDLESDTALQQALTFLSVSVALAYIAQIPFLPSGQNKELMFGILAIQSGLVFALNVGMVILVWRMVGAKGQPRKILIASCYFSGLSTIIFLAFSLLGAGAYKILDPVGFQQMVSGAIPDPLDQAKSGGYQVYIGMLTLGFLATYVWILAIWGAYRQMLQMSKRRSAVAFLLFTMLSPVLILAQMLMAYSLALSRTTPAVPNDLLGVWQAQRQSDVNGIHFSENLILSLKSPEFRMLTTGSYVMTEMRGSTNGKCIMSISHREFGRLLVQGSSLVLAPWQRIESTTDGCTGKTTETKKDPQKMEFQYQINRAATGWTLCLNNRFGQVCLNPGNK